MLLPQGARPPVNLRPAGRFFVFAAFAVVTGVPNLALPCAGFALPALCYNGHAMNPSSTQSFDETLWAARCFAFLSPRLVDADPAHDMDHVRRVADMARALTVAEGARLEIVLPAAWLHDCVLLPKTSPQRARASTLAAEAAGEFLRLSGYPPSLIPAVEHAIVAHSFSAGIAPRTLEAKVVQDADRLDAIGAIGIARCLLLGGAQRKPLFDSAQPFPDQRPPDDTSNVLDHFYVKLLRLAELMQTASARAEAQQRTQFMQQFLAQLRREITPPAP